jgi:intracellular sulfur oxidation DsrE/DsrF family protein
MPTNKLQSRRRTVIAGLGAAAVTLGGLRSTNSRAHADAPTPADAPPTPAEQEAWLDKPQAQHRILFDTTTSSGLGQALAFADVYFSSYKTGYGVDANDLSVLIVLHHFSTPFGFDDVIWSKYGKPLSDKGDYVVDPRTKRAPALNVYNSKAIDTLRNNGVTLDRLSEEGARFAVCDVATHGIADLLSGITHQHAETMYTELTGHLIRNAVLVPAGIVAVDRAQEHGYSYSVAV